jgi:hypothetical protein
VEPCRNLAGCILASFCLLSGGAGAQVVTEFSIGITDQQYVTLSLTNTASAFITGGSTSVRIGLLVGDVNQNRVVTVADLGLVKSQLSQLVTAANYLKDVNATGTLTVADKGITNADLTRALPPP